MKLFPRILIIFTLSGFIPNGNAVSRTLMNTGHIWREANRFSGIEKMKERKKQLLQDILKLEENDSRENDFGTINQIANKANEKHIQNSPFKSIVTDVISDSQPEIANNTKNDPELEIPTEKEVDIAVTTSKREYFNSVSDTDVVHDDTDENSDLPYIVLKNMKNTTFCDNIRCEILKSEASTVDDDSHPNISTLSKDKLVQILQNKQVYLITDSVKKDDEDEDLKERENSEESTKKNKKKKEQSKNRESDFARKNDEEDDDDDVKDRGSSKRKNKNRRKNKKSRSTKYDSSEEDDEDGEYEDEISKEELKRERKRKQKSKHRQSNSRKNRKFYDKNDELSSEESSEEEEIRKEIKKKKNTRTKPETYVSDESASSEIEENGEKISNEYLKKRMKQELNRYRLWVINNITNGNNDHKKKFRSGKHNSNGGKNSDKDLEDKIESELNRYKLWILQNITSGNRHRKNLKLPKPNLDWDEFSKLLKEMDLPVDWEKIVDLLPAYNLPGDQAFTNFTQPWDNYYNIPDLKFPPPWTSTYGVFDNDRQLKSSGDSPEKNIGNRNDPSPWKITPVEKFLIRNPQNSRQLYGNLPDSNPQWSSTPYGPNGNVQWTSTPSYINNLHVTPPSAPNNWRSTLPPSPKKQWIPTTTPNNYKPWVLGPVAPVTTNHNRPWTITPTPPGVTYQWGPTSTPPTRQWYSNLPINDNQHNNDNKQWNITPPSITNNDSPWNDTPFISDAQPINASYKLQDNHQWSAPINDKWNNQNQQSTISYTPNHNNQQNQPASIPANDYNQQWTSSKPPDNNHAVNKWILPSQLAENKNRKPTDDNNKFWTKTVSPIILSENTTTENIIQITKKPKYFTATNDTQNNDTLVDTNRNIHINIHIHNDKKDAPTNVTVTSSTPTIIPKISYLNDPFVTRIRNRNNTPSNAYYLLDTTTGTPATTRQYQNLDNNPKDYFSKLLSKNNRMNDPYNVQNMEPNLPPSPYNKSILVPKKDVIKKNKKNYTKQKPQPMINDYAEKQAYNKDEYYPGSHNQDSENSGKLQEVTTPVIITENTPEPEDIEFNPDEWNNIDDAKRYFYGNSDLSELSDWEENLVTPFSAYKNPPFAHSPLPQRKKESEAKRFSNKLKQFLGYLTNKKNMLNGTDSETTKKLEKNIKELYDILNNIEKNSTIDHNNKTENSSKDDKLERIDKLLEQLPNILNSSMALLRKLSDKVSQIDKPTRINVENSTSEQIRKVKIKKGSLANITSMQPVTPTYNTPFIQNPQMNQPQMNQQQLFPTQFNHLPFKPVLPTMWQQPLRMIPRNYDPRMNSYVPYYQNHFYPAVFNQRMHRNPRFVSFPNPFGNMPGEMNMQNYKQPKQRIMRYNPTIHLDFYEAHNKNKYIPRGNKPPHYDINKPNTGENLAGSPYGKTTRNAFRHYYQHPQIMQNEMNPNGNSYPQYNFNRQMMHHTPFRSHLMSKPISLDQPPNPQSNFRSGYQHFNQAGRPNHNHNFNHRYQQNAHPHHQGNNHKQQNIHHNNQFPEFDQQYPINQYPEINPHNIRESIQQRIQQVNNQDPDINPNNIRASIQQRIQQVNANQNAPIHPHGYLPQSVGPQYFNDKSVLHPSLQYRVSSPPDVSNPEKYLNTFMTDPNTFTGPPQLSNRSEREDDESLSNAVEENLEKIQKFLKERENQEITPELLEQLNANPYVEIVPCNKTSSVEEEEIKEISNEEPA